MDSLYIISNKDSITIEICSRREIKINLPTSEIFIAILNVKYILELILDLVAKSYFKDKKLLKNNVK